MWPDLRHDIGRRGGAGGHGSVHDRDDQGWHLGVEGNALQDAGHGHGGAVPQADQRAGRSGALGPAPS